MTASPTLSDKEIKQIQILLQKSQSTVGTQISGSEVHALYSNHLNTITVGFAIVGIVVWVVGVMGWRNLKSGIKGNAQKFANEAYNSLSADLASTVSELTGKYEHIMKVQEQQGANLHAEQLWNQGNLYMSQERHRQAVENYTASIKINPHVAIVYYNRGNAYFDMGMFAKALKDYDACIDVIRKGEEALSLNPSNNNPLESDAFFNKACAYAKMAPPMSGQAVQALEEAIKLNIEVRKSARTEKDLAAIRTSKEFIELIGISQLSY